MGLPAHRRHLGAAESAAASASPTTTTSGSTRSPSTARIPVAYQYDPDRLFVQAGDLTLSRDAQNGLFTGATLGNANEAYTYNSFGEVSDLPRRLQQHEPARPRLHPRRAGADHPKSRNDSESNHDLRLRL
jgi:hypothetical protein